MVAAKFNPVTCSKSEYTVYLSGNDFPMDKLTFQELMDRHPIIARKGWVEEEFVVFMKTGLIRAELRDEDDVLLIDEESVFKLIDFHDSIIDNHKIDLEFLKIKAQKD